MVLVCSCLLGGSSLGLSAPVPKIASTLNTPNFLSDYAVTRGFSLGRPLRARPLPGGQGVLFLRSEARSPRLSLYEFDPVSGTAREVLSPEKLSGSSDEQLSPEEKARRERMRVSTTGITSFDLSEDGSKVLVSLSGQLFVYTRNRGSVQKLATSPGTLLDPRFSPDGTQVAYVLEGDLYAFDLAGGKERRLTEGASDELTHGLAEFVAQEEMDRFTGYWWSPDSRFIAYEEADASGVEAWHPSDPAKPGAEIYAQRYPRPGKANVSVRLGILPAGGGRTTWVSWERARFPYLATVKWEQGGPLTLVVQDRHQRQEQVLAVDTTTGQSELLLSESDPAWLNLDQQTPRWLVDGSGFLWTSEREGGPQLELRDRRGQLVRVLLPATSGYIPEKNALAVDERTRQVYYQFGPDPTTTQISRVPLDGGKPEALTSGQGQHLALFAKDFSLSVRSESNPRTLTNWSVYDREGRRIGALPSVALESPFIPHSEIVQVTTPEQLTFYCSLVRPQNFDPARRYPVIVDVYGGPGAQKVSATMVNYLRPQWLADQGFIVVSIDGRGTPGRGRDWERAIAGNFAAIPLDDQVSALKALGKRLHELDLSRVGITGWSFGGYMSALAVLRRPDIFKAAVAGAPVVDWLDYDTHYTERYLGLPADNPQGYEQSSLLTYAAKLERPLLIVHGTSDDNVFFLHSLKLSDALFRAGRDHQILPLSGLTHMVPDPQVRIRLEERTARFFQEHL
ncbi:S9 family peptidase [Gloeobacter kilaueensis]|uniref:Dipeptidyl peptidase IV n=1 Tax=Gloeobacter kilaueensis (strain ATCC BAA-2537 / CCAP 1431/1 / ULC 316 / JS1) TaxID=1183438 RepID=U5QD46_GLOK1|nr:dipeptidyl peptidase IV [Gloeobacter kilaueensis JS1]